MAPLGLLYLSSWLRRHGHEPQIIDLAGVEDWKSKIRQESAKLNCDYLGITCTTPQYPVAKRIRNFVKNELGFNHLPVVVGGIHLTSVVKNANELDFMAKDQFDSYIVGEGYNAVTKMCDDLKNGGLKKMYAEPILKDVNELPFAARDLIDINSYSYKLGDTPSTTFYSQYGCMYNCLSADSLIKLANGSQMSIDKICQGDFVLNTGRQKSIVTAKRQMPVKKQSYEVELESGEKIVASENHPVLTQRGWIKVAHLTDGDVVLVDNAEKNSNQTM